LRNTCPTTSPTPQTAAFSNTPMAAANMTRSPPTKTNSSPSTKPTPKPPLNSRTRRELETKTVPVSWADLRVSLRHGFPAPVALAQTQSRSRSPLETRQTSMCGAQHMSPERTPIPGCRLVKSMQTTQYLATTAVTTTSTPTRAPYPSPLSLTSLHLLP